MTPETFSRTSAGTTRLRMPEPAEAKRTWPTVSGGHRTLEVLWAAVFCLALSIAHGAGAQQRWIEAYDNGLAALKRGDGAAAEEYFKVAVDSGPKTRTQSVLRYGTRRAPFYPEYFLAMSYLQQGKASQAAELLRRVQRENLLDRNAPESAQLAGNIETADRQVQQLASVTAPAPTPASPTPTPSTPALPTPAAPPPPVARPEVSPSPPAGLDRVQIERARVERESRDRLDTLLRLGEAELTAKRFGQARRLGLESSAFGIDPARAQGFLRRVDIEEALEGLRSAVAARNWTEGQRLSARLKALDPANLELAALVRRIDEGVVTLAAGELERAALRAYYSGQYQETLDLMAKLMARTGATPSARAYFYSACSHIALGLLEGGTDPTRLTTARELYAKARPLANQLAADRRFISPSILQALDRP